MGNDPDRSDEASRSTGGELGPPYPPGSLYRLQLRGGMGFDQARRLVPYLHALGVTHLYASPVFRARSGSTHGYDVVDPTRLDPSLGDRKAFDDLVGELHALGMGLVLDVVPNHMAASGDNRWWWDVLRHGRASPFAHFFDVDWNAPGLEGKVLMPVLGDQYGAVLERGELVLELSQGELVVRYFEHRYPVDPATSGRVLRDGAERLAEMLGAGDPTVRRLRRILAQVDSLPPRSRTSPRAVERRTRATERIDRGIRGLCAEASAVVEVLKGSVSTFGGGSERPAAMEGLDALIGDQAYVLAHWRAARQEVDYRRFFDVTDLVSLRVQDPSVFEATNGPVIDLVRDGRVAGLRIDHVDGLYDPQSYLERLGSRLGGEPSRRGARGRSPYVVVEKILAEGESLRSEWRTAGTTGYEFLDWMSAVQTDPHGVQALGAALAGLAGPARPFRDLVVSQKRAMMDRLFGAEVGALGVRLQRLARDDRRGRDLTLQDLTAALVEVTAALPVYRTYVRTALVEAPDRGIIDRAVAAARPELPAEATAALSFLRSVLLLELPPRASAGRRRSWLEFVMRWQQFTGPVMAKGSEDTALYVDVRLLSRNDVGTDPGVAAISVEEFHRRVCARRRRWPGAVSTTSTHDTKRSEDVRARLAVLSEIPDRWSVRVQRWMRWNAAQRRKVDGRDAPSPAEEWLLYQTMVGTWDARGGDGEYLGRIQAYMRKALREAKMNSTWTDPNDAYERAVEAFVRGILAGSGSSRRFLDDLDEVASEIAFHGALNSLALTLLKVAAPGVPDVYQGTELWDLSLVDPDNRRPVDFDLRARMLEELDRLPGIPSEHSRSVAEDLLASWPDGRIKLFVASRSLRFRRDHPDLFGNGAYLPLRGRGPRKAHVLAFARRRRSSWALAAVALRTATLAEGMRAGRMPVGKDAWGATVLLLPPSAPALWVDRLTGRLLPARPAGSGQALALEEVFGTLPVALMERAT